MTPNTERRQQRKQSIKQILKRFDCIKTRIQKDRDDLRQWISDAEDILDTNTRAAETLDEAADALSELL